MFRALTCPSSGGKIVFTQHLLSSLSVNVCTVHRLKALDMFRALTCPKYFEDNNVTNILLLNKVVCIKVG
jgi:hypothetical protein